MATIDFAENRKEAVTTLRADNLNVDLLQLLATRYVVVVEREDNHIIYELYDKNNYA